MSIQLDEKKDFENAQVTDEMFFQPVTICSNPLKAFENSKSITNILQPSSISKNNIVNNNLSYSPNKFRELNQKNAIKSGKRCHTENSVNDENTFFSDNDRKENIIHSTNKLASGISLTQVENKSESLNESIYRYNDQIQDQTEALLEKDEEIQMLKAKRMADSIEISYLKNLVSSLQNTSSDKISIIDEGENFTFYNIYLLDENDENTEEKENMIDLYIEQSISRLIDFNTNSMRVFDLEVELQKSKDDQTKERIHFEKRTYSLESMIQVEQMFHRSLDQEKKNLITKLADLEIKLENQTSQQKQYQEYIQKLKQELTRQQEKIEFREYEINQLKEKKNVYQSKLKDYSDINQEYKLRIEEKDKQLEELKEKISEPIENINMVFSIVSNYKQTLAQFDEKIAELIQKQKVIDKLERQLGDKNEQMMMLVKMSNQMQEKINLLINDNSQQELIIQDLSQKLHSSEMQGLQEQVKEQEDEIKQIDSQILSEQPEKEETLEVDPLTNNEIIKNDESEEEEETVLECFKQVVQFEEASKEQTMDESNEEKEIPQQDIPNFNQETLEEENN